LTGAPLPASVGFHVIWETNGFKATENSTLPAQNIVTITTDFGVRDHFVGAMKGVILTINPEANLLDISHDVVSFSVVDGAFTIAQAYSYFPSGTVHLVIVDPGVGGQRRPILVQTGRHCFVGPDNGIFSFIYEREERVTVRHITASHYFLQPVSRTFHGRDIFSPIAAWLTKGIDPAKFGEPISDYRRFANLNPTMESEKRARGIVLKADKFGNLITNVSIAHFPQFVQPEAPVFQLEINGQQITHLRNTFEEGAPGEVFAIVGSSGYLELVCNGAAASRALNAGPGNEVVLTFK
jgi:S-adenosyl-L-methionine hydrolase (adenosine-forming)